MVKGVEMVKVMLEALFSTISLLLAIEIEVMIAAV